LYSRLVARWLGVDPTRVTPAVRLEDGVDYAPTGPGVLFGHHFASIAAAGPIIGPALAAAFGFVPAWLWLVFGVVFIGAVHDYAALFVSIREDGRSIAEVARSTLGTAGFLLYASFAILLCVLVSAAFLDITAKTLTATLPLALLGLPADQTLLSATVVDGVARARVGGIASTSVVAITAMAPALGWMLYRRRMNPWLAAAVAFVGCGVSVAVGLAAPMTLDPSVWMLIVLAYTVVAGFVPVWLVIQPRDFINVQFLYVGLAVMVLSLIGCGLHGVVVDLPAFSTAEAAELPGLGAAWPFLFITIACGSVSGAHGLVASGTTSKQVRSETHARWIGYGGMLLESLLGICVLLLLAGAVGATGYRAAVWDEGAPGAGVAFAIAVGQGVFQGVGSPESAPWLAAYGTVFGILLLEGFLVTTIDTVVRLSRYLLEEVWGTVFEAPPAWARNRVVNTLIIVVPVAALAFTSGYKTIWPVFGGANQLLAALTLIAVTAWLVREGRSWWFAALPAAFMTITTIAALSSTLWTQARGGQIGVAIAAGTLLALAGGVLAVTAKRIAVTRAAS
jgi:carbon starvation protein